MNDTNSGYFIDKLILKSFNYQNVARALFFPFIWIQFFKIFVKGNNSI